MIGTVGRCVAIFVAGFALAGCATIIPFQSSDEVIVRVGDKPDTYPVRPVAVAYASYAKLAAVAYHDTGRKVAGWRRVPLPKYKCPANRICAGEVGEQLWIRSNGKTCQEAVIVFRGTVASSFDDWFANFHWLHRLTPVDDYYDQARNNIASVVDKAERQGCAGRIIAVGHSLGGGLAQHVAYANKKIRTVYAFDPSFVVGSTDFNLLGLEIHREDRKFDYVYEHGEILAFLRFIGRQFHPYEACNPRIRTVRFNTMTGSLVNQHRIDGLADKLAELSRPAVAQDIKRNAAPPPGANKKFNLRAGCPVQS